MLAEHTTGNEEHDHGLAGPDHASIIAAAAQDITTDDATGQLEFYTSSTGNPQERLRINSTGTINILQSGSGALPSLYFAGDEDTGIYRVGNDQLGFATAGAHALVIDAAREVGIGDVTPDANLEVSANNETGGAIFYVSSNDNTDGDRFAVLEDGNVGIGTNTPISTLEVSATGGSGGGVLTLTRDDATITNGDAVGQLDFYGDDTQLTTQNLYAQIFTRAAGTTSTDAAAGELVFSTTGTTLAGSPVERLVIDEAGLATFNNDATISGVTLLNGNTTIGDANTDTLTINAGSSGSGITLADSSFFSCTALETDASGVLTCGTDDVGGAGGISSLNGLTGATQTFAVGTTGTDFNINSTGTVHTFNIPDAGTGISGGLITNTSQTLAGPKTFTSNPTIQVASGASLTIDATDGGGAPATTTSLVLDGYEGRAKGIFITDEDDTNEFFIGELYNAVGIGIGLDTVAGNQSEYAANSQLFIAAATGNVLIGGTAGDDKLEVRGTAGSDNIDIDTGDLELNDIVRIANSGALTVTTGDFTGDITTTGTVDAGTSGYYLDGTQVLHNSNNAVWAEIGAPHVRISPSGVASVGSATPANTIGLGIQGGNSIGLRVTTNDTADVGAQVVASAAQTANLFETVNSGATVLSGFDADGDLFFQNSTFTGTVDTATLTGNQTYTLPDASGTVCLTSGNCAGVGGTGDILDGGNSTGSTVVIGTNDANSLQFETGGNSALTIADGGAITLQNEIDSSNGFQILDVDGGDPVFNVDTDNERVRIGAPSGTAARLQVEQVGANAGLVVHSGNNTLLEVRNGTSRVKLQTLDTGEGIVGTASNNPFYIRSNNTNAITVDTAQNVGIGTTSPDEELEVANTQNTRTAIAIENLDTGANANSQLRLETDGGEALIYRTSDAYGFGLADDLVIQDSGGGDTVLWNGGAERLRIGASGLTTISSNLTISGGTDYGIYYRDGSGNVVTSAAGTSGQCLLSAGAGAPTWGACAPTGGTSLLTLTGDSGADQDILTGDTLDIAGGTNIDTVVGATDTLTVNVIDNPTFAGLVTANAGIDVSTYAVSPTTIRSYNTTNDSDITGLISGTAVGGIIEAPLNAHQLIGLRENGGTDSFAIVSGGGNWSSDTTYDYVALQVTAGGDVTVGDALTVNGASTLSGLTTANGGLTSNGTTTVVGTTNINTGTGNSNKTTIQGSEIVVYDTGIGTYENLIDNPGFETGDEDDGWANTGDLTLESTLVRTGNYAGTSTSDGGNNYIFQTVEIPAEEGDEFYGSVWIHAVGAAGQGSLRFQWLNAAKGQISNTYPGFGTTAADTWEQQSGNATAPAGTAYLRVAIRIGSGTTGVVHKIDDVYVTKSQTLPSLTIASGGELTVNGDAITDLTGSGLSIDGSGVLNVDVTGAGGVDGSGTANQLAYFSDADTLTSSSNLTYDGTALTLTSTTTSPILTVNGGGARSLTISETGDDYSILNDEQDNGIVLYDGGGGVEILYGGTSLATFDLNDFTVNGLSRLDDVNIGSAITISDQNSVAAAADILFDVSGVVAAEETLYINIDSDASNANGALIIGGDAATSSASQLLRVNESGLTDFGRSDLAGQLGIWDGTSNRGTIQTAALSAGQTYTLPNASGDICLSSGNCAGVGGTGDITGAGTANQVAYFDAAKNITSGSGLTFDGSDLAVDGSTLFVDASQNNVGIGTAAPSSTLEVVGGITDLSSATEFTDSALYVSNPATGLTYPSTSGFIVTPGINNNINLSTSQTVNSTTPGGFNFAYGQRNTITFDEPTTPDVSRLYIDGVNTRVDWDSPATAVQLIGDRASVNYRGQDNASQTTSSVTGVSARGTLIAPASSTQTVVSLTGSSGNAAVTNGANTNVTNNITDQRSFYGFLNVANTADNNVSNITNLSSYDNFVALNGSGTGSSVNVTNLYGLRLQAPTLTGTVNITNRYGVSSEDAAALNYFAGDINLNSDLSFNDSGFTGTFTPAALSANQTYTLPNASGTLCLSVGNCTGASIGGFTQGSVFFANTDGTITEDNGNFFYDDVNDRLRLGATSGSSRLTIEQDAGIAGITVQNGTNPLITTVGGTTTGKLQSITNGSVYVGAQTNDNTSLIVNNSPVLTADTDGEVGIGTTSPGYDLQIQGATPELLIGTASNTEGAIYFGNTSHGVQRNYSSANDVGLYTTSGSIYLSGGGTSTSQFQLESDGDLRVDTDTLTVDAVNNRVGIGDGTPESQLQIGTNTINQQWNSGGEAQVLIQGVDNEAATKALEVKDENLQSLFTVGTYATGSLLGYTDVGGDLLVGNNIVQSGGIQQTDSGASYVYENLASSYQGGNNRTGAIVIETNIPRASPVEWIRDFEFSFYNYEGNNQAKFDLSWYNFSSSFVNHGYSRSGSIDPRIRLGLDASSNVVVVIGDVADTYSYPAVEVSRVVSSSGVIADYEGWTIVDDVTDLSPYSALVDVNEENAFVGQSIEIGSDTITDFTGTGLTVSSGVLTVTGSAGLTAGTNIDATDLAAGTVSVVDAPTFSGEITAETYINLDNGSDGIIRAENTTGTLENVLYGRWTNNRTYLDGGTGGLQFRVNSGSTNAAIVDASGNFSFYQGVSVTGTTTSTGLLTAESGAAIETSNAGTAITSSGNALQVINTDATNNNWANIVYGDQTNGAAAVIAGAQITDHTNNYGNYAIWTRGATTADTRLFVEADGQVGIGTTTPSALLDVDGDAEINGTLTFENGETISNATDGALTIAGHLYPAADSTYDIGQAEGTNEWRNAFFDGTVRADFLRSDADILATGGDFYDNSGDVAFRGEDNVIIGIDYNNNDADTRYFSVVNNTPLSDFTTTNELFRVAETGDVTINNLTNCDTIDTDANGVLSCGTDDTGSGGATTALDNLASVAINTDLLPDTDDTYDLGSSTLRWQDLYLGPQSLHVFCNASECGSDRDWSLGVIETAGAAQGNLTLGLAGADNLVIDTAGQVGIGTAEPNYDLEVSSPSAGAVQVVATQAGTGTGDWAELIAANGSAIQDTTRLITLGTNYSTTGGFVQDGAALSTDSGLSGGLSVITRANAPIRFYTNGESNERLRITETGEVGIGTDTPTRLLELEGASAQLAISDTDGNSALLLNSLVTTPAADTLLGTVNFRGLDDGGAESPYAKVRGYVTDDTAGSEDGYLTIETSEAGTSTEQVRVTSDGTNINGLLTVDPDSNSEGIRIFGADEANEIADIFVDSAGNLELSTIAGNDTGYIELRPENSSFGVLIRETDGTGTSNYANFNVVDDATSDYLNIVVDSANSATGLVLNDQEFVGIGTTSPGFNLEIANTADAAIFLRADTDDTTESDNPYIVYTQDDDEANGNSLITGLVGSAGFAPDASAYTSTLSNAAFIGAVGTTKDLQLGTNGAVRLTIEDTGDVGIGTATPSHKLEVAGTSFFDGVAEFDSQIHQPYSGNASYNVWIQGSTSGSGDARNLALLGVSIGARDELIINYNSEYDCLGVGVTDCDETNDALTVGGNIGFSGSDNFYFGYNATSDVLYFTGEKNGGTAGADILNLVSTESGGGDTSVRVSQLVVGLNTTEANITSYNTNEKLNINTNGTGEIDIDAGTSGTVRLEGVVLNIDTPTRLNSLLAVGANPITLCHSDPGGSTNYITSCTSLGAWKEDVQDLDLGLDAINQLNPVRYNWINGGTADLGFIAEEVEAVNPLLAQYDDNGDLSGVKYRHLTALLAEGIQELDDKVEALEVTTQTQEDRIVALEAAVFDDQFVDLTVSGTATINELAVTANADIDGTLTVVGDATIDSDLLVSGTLTVESGLTTSRITTSGDTPVATPGADLDINDTVAIEGNDVAGTVTITLDALSAANLGEVLDTSFVTDYDQAPRVALTAKDASSASIRVFIETSDTGFTVSTIDALTAGETYTFDYIIIE
ncbi:MAG: tail fiber domain-containing protein [Patescibacteria group bacterium]